ncbi:MAG TPA: NYN domain-containing protein, partial [Rhodopila sp.]|uniref:NYN domain-containing protein n=1 Tax=Rhodopila sp. TaxID=2480087 RepID=UPI002CB95C85
KGVDSLIVTDPVELARNRAMTDAVLVSGDEDVRIGVVLAQQFGVRVHLVGIHPARANQSPSLRQEADTILEWDAPVVRAFLAYSPPVSPSMTLTAAVTGDLEALIEPLIAALPVDEISRLKVHVASSSQIPAEHDKALLRIGRTHYGTTTLMPDERAALRGVFVRLVRAL